MTLYNILKKLKDNEIIMKIIDQYHKAAPDYSIAFKNSGFNDKVVYIPSQPKSQTRKRQII